MTKSTRATTAPDLLPCPFCGGPVELERTLGSYEKMHGEREWWGVKCYNTTNVGGSCAIQQLPSASKEAATERWNRRAPSPSTRGAIPKQRWSKEAEMMESWAGGESATDSAVPVKDHVLREVVNALRDVAIKYHGTGQLRARLRAELGPLLAARKPAPVARDKLLTIIGYAYQIAAAHDAPAHILDVLCDPEAASAEQVEAMLPYAPVARDSICSRCPKETAYGPAYCWECAVARELDDRPVYMERCGENSDYWTVITKEEHDSWIEDGFPEKVRAFYSRQATAESAPASAAPDEQWISTSERMPKDCEIVLVFHHDPYDTEPQVWSAQWLAGSETFESTANGWVHAEEVSHWRALPASPSNTSPVGADTSKESK